MADKIIIANYGEPNTGKTKSIGLVYEYLSKVADPGSPNILRTDKDDFCAILVINGIKVGIASQGDPWSHQRVWIDLLIESGCVIIIAACRHYGATVKVIESYADDFRIYWTCNARIYENGTDPRKAPNDEILDRFNEQWAEKIVNLIESWCNA